MSDGKLEKVVAPVAAALIIAITTAAGTGLYRHELRILGNAKAVEQLRIKDYRQHRDALRNRVRQLGESVTTLGGVLQGDPLAFGPSGAMILAQRKEMLAESRELLENYIEENKHQGKGDGS